MSVSLEQLLATTTAWHVETDEPWRVRAEDGYPVALCGTLPGTPDPNPTRAERHAALIALAPDMARLLIDMGEELRKHNWRPDKMSENINALLARLDELGKDTA